MKNIAFITTVNHNIGDDFVREGLKHLLKTYLEEKGETAFFTEIHKHVPITTRYGFEKMRIHQLISNKLDALLPLFLTKDKVLEADILIQSGAPVYWCHPYINSHCATNEWYSPLVRRRLSQNKKAKFLNLAAGTCQKYHSDGKEFADCPSCSAYIKEMYEKSAVTTLRDTLAQDVLSLYQLQAPVIPCSSIFAKDFHGITKKESEYVVVNYMAGGAHYTFEQNIDFTKWQKEFAAFYHDIKHKETIVFACHNQKEVNEAKAIDPKANIYFKENDFKAFIEFYSKAKFGIMNRVHGAFIMGSFETPSIIIGNDTRARMGKEIGIDSLFVNDATAQELHKQFEFLSNGANDYANRFRIIKEKAFSDYMAAFERAKIC